MAARLYSDSQLQPGYGRKRRSRRQTQQNGGLAFSFEKVYFDNQVSTIILFFLIVQYRIYKHLKYDTLWPIYMVICTIVAGFPLEILWFQMFWDFFFGFLIDSCKCWRIPLLVWWSRHESYLNTVLCSSQEATKTLCRLIVTIISPPFGLQRPFFSTSSIFSTPVYIFLPKIRHVGLENV